jgi:folate-binding protein YgfZ
VVWKRAEDLFLDLPRVAAGTLRAHFARYLPPRLARVEAVPDAVVVRLLGPASEGVLRAAGAPPDAFTPGRFGAFPGAAGPLLAGPREPGEGGGHDVLHRGGAGSPGWTDLLGAVAAAGGDRVPAAAYEAWRVEHGIPLYGRDFDDGNLPQETGLTGRTVSFEKGCYTGQEVVARIHYRGHVNRLLRGLLVRPGTGVSTGDPLFLGDREVGRVGSSVVSPRLGPIALAVVRREVDPGTELSLSPAGPVGVTVVPLPFT